MVMNIDHSPAGSFRPSASKRETRGWNSSRIFRPNLLSTGTVVCRSRPVLDGFWPLFESVTEEG